MNILNKLDKIDLNFEIYNNFDSEAEENKPLEKPIDDLNDKDDLNNSNIPVNENDVINISRSVILTKNIINNTHVCYLLGEIVYNIKEYIILFNLLDSLGKTDKISIYIDSYGGSVDSGLLLCSAIKRCKAEVTTCILGVGFSMGSMIWSYGDKLELLPGAMTMFHNISSGFFGYIGNIKKEVEHINEIGNMMLQGCVDKGILTLEEKNSILETNKEYFFPYDVMIERILKTPEAD